MMQKALFLDRDGVINIDHGYVSDQANFEFMPGIFDLCHAAQDAGYLIMIITNQSGVGRGYYTQDDYDRLMDWMMGEFTKQDIKIHKAYACFSSPESNDPRRKPGAGMLLEAISEFDIDPDQSIMIGDKLTDMQAAESANIKTRIHFQAARGDRLLELIQLMI